MNWYVLYGCFTGRIGRSHFWAGLLGILVLELLIFLPLMQIYGADVKSRPAALWFRNLTLLLDAALAWPTLAVLVKRQRDRDQTAHLSYIVVASAIFYSALDAFGLIVTPAGVTSLGYAMGLLSVGLLMVVLVELGIRPGVEGHNQFGEGPVVSLESD